MSLRLLTALNEPDTLTSGTRHGLKRSPWQLSAGICRVPFCLGATL